MSPQGSVVVQLEPLPVLDTYATLSAAYESVLGWTAVTAAMTAESFAMVRIVEIIGRPFSWTLMQEQSTPI
jgi:hypothetical protein